MSADTHSPRLRAEMPVSALRGAAALRLTDLFALARQRRKLADLDARALQDIGVSRDAALREASRAPWDVPAGWRR